MNQHEQQPYESSSALEESPRFALPKRRRDILGLAAVWSALGTLAVAVFGALRLPMPAVLPESNPKVKIGLPDNYPKGSATYLSELNLWVFRNDGGQLYAISAVCTHLGCIVKRLENGQFLCPCHGASYAADGKVLAGPAPAALNWLELSLAPDGQIMVDKTRTVRRGQDFLS